MDRISPSRPSGLRSGCALPAPGRTRPAPAAALRCPESAARLSREGTPAVPGPESPAPGGRKSRLPAIFPARAGKMAGVALRTGGGVGINLGIEGLPCFHRASTLHLIRDRVTAAIPAPAKTHFYPVFLGKITTATFGGFLEAQESRAISPPLTIATVHHNPCVGQSSPADSPARNGTAAA